MFDDDRRLLTHLVASLEVIFRPYRGVPTKPVDKGHAAVVEKRARYHRGEGLAWVTGGDGKDRQRGFVSLRRLQSSGLIRIHPGRRVQRSGVSLRRLDACLSVCPINTTRESWPLLAHLAALADSPDVLRNCGFLVEHDVVGIDHESTDGTLVERFTDRAIPLLIAGLVETACDVNGLMGWRLTKTGRAALATGPTEPDELLKYDPALADEYLARVEVGLADRSDWAPERQCVTVPLSCGLWMDGPQWDARRRRLSKRTEADVDG